MISCHIAASVERNYFQQLGNNIQMKEGGNQQLQGMRLLEKLVKRVKETVQTKADHQFLDKYRCHFQITQPSLLVGGELKKYQLEALEWMINLAAQDSNGILADDMGLGKTIQAISYLAYQKEEHGILGKHLIVCPKSVASNWQRELKKWFPSARVEMMILNINTREAFLKQILKPKKFDIIIVNYEGAKTCIDQLARIKWETLIVDEAHKLKNYQSQNFICLDYLRTTFRLLLTGTPLNNNLKELWTLLNFIMPGLFDEEDIFERIEESLKNYQGSEEERLSYQCKIAKHFHEIINPFFKRRIKKDLELGLPEKTELTIFVPLSKLQVRMYRNYLRFGNVMGDIPPANYNVMVPRKICQHPYLFQKIEQSQGFLEDSGKLVVLDKLVTKLIAEKHKILIFSQFVIVLDVLASYCRLKDYNFSRIDGSDSLEDRDKAVRRFYDDPNYNIFLISTKAGGLGLNLVAADRVIIYDIDWNPQNDLQAMDRAYRIGQTKPVTVYRLVTEKTIEERMLEFQKYKLIWDDLVIQKGLVFGRGKDDPFSNVNFNYLSRLGKGDIIHLETDRRDQTIQEILQLGVEKDKQKQAQIRERLKKQISEGQKVSIFQQQNKDDDFDTDQNVEEDAFIERRNYDNDKRQRAKFERALVVPAFKFYTHIHEIKDIEFQIYMQSKRENKNEKLMQHLYHKLQEAQSKGRFHNWSQFEFELFVKAHGSWRKTQYQEIAKAIGSKTEQEVKNYSTYFFEKAPNNEKLINSLKEIQRLQARLGKGGSSQNGTNSETKVKLVSQDKSKQSSENNNDEASESSAGTQNKQQKKSRQKTKQEIEQARKQRQRLKQQREKAKQEQKQARLKKREQEKLERERKKEQQAKRKEQARIKKEQQAKAKAESNKLKEEQRAKRNAEREIKKQKELEERERKKVEDQSKKKQKAADRSQKEVQNEKKVEKQSSPSKRTEKSGGKQAGCSAETKQKRTSKEKLLAVVTVHDN